MTPVRRIAAIPLVLGAFAALATASASAHPSYSPGAAGVGDRLFRLLGNGGYDARHYDLALHYESTAPDQDVRGRVTMRAVATQGLSRFNLDFSGGAVHAVWVNGRSAAFSREGGELVITPPRPLHDHKHFTAVVSFTSGPEPPGPDPSGQFPSNPFPTGWFTTTDGSVTAGQPDRSSMIYPVNDHPSDKATYDFTLAAPREATVVATGVLAGRFDLGSRLVWRYRLDDPMASQLIQVAFGDLDVIRRGRFQGTELRDVVAAPAAATSEPTLAKTPAHIRWLTGKVGRYPFDSYGSLAAGQFFRYALETQTLSLYPTLLFDPAVFPPNFVETVMVHELAHQWFGDDLAIATWSDLWLSEGHATWYEHEYDAETFGADFEAFMRGEYAIADQMRADSGPVALPNSAETLFSNQVYGGGALVLYALRQEIGDRAFRTIERQWAHRYSGESVTTEQFIALACKVVRRDLGPFLRDWLYGAETPPMPGHPEWTTGAPASSALRAGGVTLLRY